MEQQDEDIKGFDIDAYEHEPIPPPENEKEFDELMSINAKWVSEIIFLDQQIARVNLIVPITPPGLRDKMRREWKIERLKRKKEHRAMVAALKIYNPNAMLEAW